mgnify:CR=1 FL=1
MKLKVNFVFNPNDLKDIAAKVDEGYMQQQFQYIVDKEIKDSISKGISPVRGKRSFAKYKDKNKYPGDKKQSNKPNLKLTGELLDNYTARTVSGEIAVTIGIHSDASDFVKTKANANQNGTKTKGGEVAIAARPFIIQEGEEFNSQISIAIMKAFANVISKALKSMKGR